MTTKIETDNINLGDLASISTPKITSVQITDSNYNIITDAASNIGGGYMIINGDGFSSNPLILVDTVIISNYTRVSNTLIRAELPSYFSGTYLVQIINPEGSSAILINGITYSSFPAWITSSNLPTREAIAPVNIQISANDNQNSVITYALATANTLPTGLTLYSNGFIQGIVPIAFNDNTTYNFTVIATDAQNQKTSQMFSFPISKNTPPAWLFQSDSLPFASPVTYYSNTLIATDPAIASYTITSGSLPTGLSLDPITGIISGVNQITTIGALYPFVVTATDTAGFSASKSLSITIGQIFQYVSLLLKTNNVNTANNHSFVDSSTNRFQVTRAGDATQGTFTPFSQAGWSNYFDGTGDYLTIAHNAALSIIGDTDACIELFFYVTTSGVNGLVDKSGISGTSYPNYNLGISAANKITFVLGNSGSPGSVLVTLTGATTIAVNQWYHVVCTKRYVGGGSVNEYRIFVNGVLDATTTAANPSDSRAGPFYIGRIDQLASNDFDGYMASLRISNSSIPTTYQTTSTTLGAIIFTPPTAPLTALANTVLLTCQSNRFVDNSSNGFTVTASGGASVQVFSPFASTAEYSANTNGGSAYFDGTGDALTFPASNTQLLMGTGQFTFEWWLYPLDLNFRQLVDTGTTFGHFRTFQTAGGMQIWTGPTQLTTGGIALRGNSWNHLVVQRNATQMSSYINGVRDYNANNADDYNTGTLSIGTGALGYFSGFKYTKGSAAYSGANITIPTAPPTPGNSLACLNFTNLGIYDATGKNNIQTVGDAKVSTAVSKYAGSAMAFDGTGDYLAMRGSPGFDFGTGNFTIEAWVNFITLATAQVVCSVGSGTGAGNFLFLFNPTLGLRFYLNGGATDINQGSTSGWSINTWYHVACVRSGTTLTLYRNGIAIASGACSTQVGTTGIFYIGGDTQPTSSNAYIEDVRVLKGAAIYSGNFIPPTIPLQAKG